MWQYKIWWWFRPVFKYRLTWFFMGFFMGVMLTVNAWGEDLFLKADNFHSRHIIDYGKPVYNFTDEENRGWRSNIIDGKVQTKAGEWVEVGSLVEVDIILVTSTKHSDDPIFRITGAGEILGIDGRNIGQLTEEELGLMIDVFGAYWGQ